MCRLTGWGLGVQESDQGKGQETGVSVVENPWVVSGLPVFDPEGLSLCSAHG